MHDLIEPYPDVSRDMFDNPELEVFEADSFVLMPLAYAHDEPIRELLSASSALHTVPIVMTGRAPSRVVKQASANVHFPGYVSDSDFRRLLSRAAVVVAPTLNEDTMQRAGYEALCAGKALVTTETRVLVDYFGDAALIAKPDAKSLARSISRAMDTWADLARRMTALRAEKIREQSTAIRALELWIATEADGAKSSESGPLVADGRGGGAR
ncbi:hypothetical protein GCM10022240_14920 [Microbacterium kribbense]|uniref:Glycosyltransferase n=1 Tax=Microbacterium kribbense TaxID=433645 RepID=A0ABP7GGZ4_9MICO